MRKRGEKETGGERAQRGAAKSSQPTANSERQRQSKQNRQRRNTESTEARAQRTRRKKLTVDGRNWEITEEKKKRPQGCPSYTRGKPALHNGLNTGLAAGNLGYGGPPKRNAPPTGGGVNSLVFKCYRMNNWLGSN